MEFEEINKIRSQFNSGLWPKFLDSIKIEGLRGLSGQTINFRFPVTAIVGENGTRKSTFLKAAVCAYVGSKKKNFLSEYFLSTYWDRITDVDIWYTVHQGPQILSFRNGKGKKKWSYSSKRPKREVFFFSISRNLPKEVSIGYAKIARFTTSEISTKELRPEIKDRLSHIMGRKYTGARFIVPDIDQRKQIGLLKRDDCCEISSFHQGAGEDATHDLMKVLQDIPDTSLVVIDEVEASLHPKAQRRLIRFLLWLSRQKRIQIILSTHSPYILEELPQEGRIMLLPNSNGMEVIYGVSPEFALSNLDDNIHPELFIYVEDRAAEILLREIITNPQDNEDLISHIKIVPVGDSSIVRTLNTLAREGKLPSKSIGISDGDEKVNGCLSLPGDQSPERIVFEGLKNAEWPGLSERFGIESGRLLTYVEDAMLDPDPHNWPELVGNRVNKSKAMVWEILASQWCKFCLKPDERTYLLDNIKEKMAS